MTASSAATRTPALPEPYGPLTRRYIRPPAGVIDWKTSRFGFARQVPLLSRSGGRAIEQHAGGSRGAVMPPDWARDLAGKRVLIMGTGPSLDRAPESMLAGFDATIYVNFALARAKGLPTDYFFTTDLGPVREYMDLHGPGDFERLGPAHCLYAPVFFDHWHYLTEAGRALFSVLRHDRAAWRGQAVRLGPLRLPLLWRYHPHQPDWESFVLPPPGPVLPVLDHSSALSAILFAAIQGAREIGLIGCDFSAGRAGGVEGQSALSAGAFAGAAAEFRRIAAALARHDITVTNHSWNV